MPRFLLLIAAHAILESICLSDEKRDLATKCLVPLSAVSLLPQNMQFAHGGKKQHLCWDPAWLNMLQICRTN